MNIAYSRADIGTCKWCLFPYERGYVCSCGWDNSYNPDFYEKTAKGYVKIQEPVNPS